MRLKYFVVAVCLLSSAGVFAQQQTVNPTGSFFSVVERMVENSPSYRSALLEIESQKTNAQPGQFSHYPSLSGGVSHSLAGTTSGEQQNSQSSSMSVSMSVPVYRFGADQAVVEQSRRTIQSADSGSRRVRVTTQREMASILLELVKVEKQIVIEDRIFHSRSAVLDKAEVLFKRGLLPAEELDKMRVELGMAEIQLSEMRTNARQVRQKSENAFGGPLSELAWAWDSSALKKMETWDSNDALRRLSQTALDELRLTVQRAEGDLVLARSGMLPSLELSGSIGKSMTHRPISVMQPGSWSVGVSASVPIFSRFDSQSRYESALLLLSSARLKLLDKEQEIRQETSKFAATIRDRIIANRQRKIFLERARNNLTKARERFLAGRISSNDLSSDENRVSQMEQALIGNEAALQQDVLQLCGLFVISLPECLSKLM